ncbi:MAG TPA: hypothetical protein VF487_01515 [Chitinophagaceae bacterium]
MKSFISVVIISMLAFSCKKLKVNNCTEPELDCSHISCFIYNSYFQFNVVDKTTGIDLVFGNNPRYATADIKLYRDAAHVYAIPLAVDNIQKHFTTSFAAAEMYLVVAGGTTYKLNVAFKGIDCCAGRVKSLQVNNELICTCCPDVISVSVE